MAQTHGSLSINSDNIFPIGYLFSDDGVVCYVNLDIERKKFFCSSDKYGINNLTGTLVPRKRVLFLPYICFTLNKLDNNIGSFDVVKLINGAASSSMSVNLTSTLAIALPEEIGTLGVEIYSSYPSISYTISFPKMTQPVRISEV